MSAHEGDVLQFIPFSSFVDIAFWHEFGRRKLDEYKLSEEPVALFGSYTAARPSGGDGEAAQAAMFQLGMEAFDGTTGAAQVRCPGSAINLNTLEAFQSFDKAAAFQAAARQIWADVDSGRALAEPALLQRWLLVCFMDLKKYNHLSIFGFPALRFAEPLRGRVTPAAQVYSAAQLASLGAGYASLGGRTGVFLARQRGDSDEFAVEADLSGYDDSALLCYVDPSSFGAHPGWPLRNVLVLMARWFGPLARLRCLGVRVGGGGDVSGSVVVDVHDVPDGRQQDWQQSTGWERDAKGRTAPKLTRLGKLLDPAALSAAAVSLNLSLMRWRVMPSLQLERVAASRVLLLGAGTLGCNVARALLGWGVQHFTFVDSGRVSFSNPPRQSLFTYEDAKRARPKAAAAADGLRAIVPSVRADALSLSIPMPGHPVGAAADQLDACRRDVERLAELVDQHDVVFLLTDSRESRWLPTLLCAAADKLCIDAALGFDTYVVMRHGVRPAASASGGVQLGCYFCNDVVAPRDSLSNRTLDQQCTVTRPGVSVLASALAVELFVAVVQHPLGAAAPGDLACPPSEPTAQPLGLLPHQIRGYLSHFANMLIVGSAFDRCTACSQHIVDAYRRDGFDFVLAALNDPKFLERVSTVTELLDEHYDDIGFEEFDDDLAASSDSE